ncbi:MAG: IPExxxVDY family protein [Ekhidna sp.]|uniref:IPExxxVDY family protein n=1 Tax=Ekhidna sp. TaxID=2608089 RepID=UPI0032EBFB07
MKKNRLDEGYAIDFELFGLVCNKKEYKLAWYLNQALKISLVKQDEIKIEYADNTSILISNYRYETEYLTIELLQNRLVGGRSGQNQLLMPELKQFDYLLKFKDDTDGLTSENVNAIIKEITIIEYAVRLNFDNLKSKENLLY